VRPASSWSNHGLQRVAASVPPRMTDPCESNFSKLLVLKVHEFTKVSLSVAPRGRERVGLRVTLHEVLKRGAIIFVAADNNLVVVLALWRLW
jgi:hypothetical protein